MVKHASSHGLSVLICTIISTYLVDLFRPFQPLVLDKMDGLSRWFINYLGLPFTKEQFSIILVAVILAAIWGAFFRSQMESE